MTLSSALVTLVETLDKAPLSEMVKACDTMRDCANDFSLPATERLLWRELLAVVSHHKDR